jgi:hypothetical protein
LPVAGMGSSRATAFLVLPGHGVCLAEASDLSNG